MEFSSFVYVLPPKGAAARKAEPLSFPFIEFLRRDPIQRLSFSARR